MHKATYLSAQLRESAPYLRDAGWRQTADLLVAAAHEIESLRSQLAAANLDMPIERQANENQGIAPPLRNSRKRNPS
jgi:hypothetical protein